MGKGLLEKPAGLGANVTVTEVDPPLPESKVGRFSVARVTEVAPIGDFLSQQQVVEM